MCIAALAWQVLPDRPVFLISNRDEFYARKAIPIGQWTDSPIIAGQDCVSHGTWLGMTQAGKWAVITNYREPQNQRNNHERSRGLLVTDYLNGQLSPMVFAQNLAMQHEYAGFNLIVGDLNQAVVLSNRGTAPTPLASGLYTLSNGLISEPWPKMERLRLRTMQEVLPLMQGVAADQQIPDEVADAVWQVLNDRLQASDSDLPITGIGPELEKVLSSIFIETPNYGTRVSSLLSLSRNSYEFLEKMHVPKPAIPAIQRLAAKLSLNP
ncbi:NRDE family protein [Alkanindiges sp. WGS2144]|uniref:NRDE family protein n=1 Tax=Alkanindiges sp. WGS2144 TaxID=3366808 RepID=UPI003753538F